MARDLTVGTDTFRYPDAGENPGWGEDATEWAQAVTDELADLKGPNDISTTTFTVADNVTTFTDITGFAFDSATSRSFHAEYNVFRTDGSSNIAESGFIYGINDGTDWYISNQYVHSAEMEFSITSSGQMQYKSSSVGGTYSGTMKFNAKTFAI
jgi:hypothetical protein